MDRRSRRHQEPDRWGERRGERERENGEDDLRDGGGVEREEALLDGPGELRRVRLGLRRRLEEEGHRRSLASPASEDEEEERNMSLRLVLVGFVERESTATGSVRHPRCSHWEVPTDPSPPLTSLLQVAPIHNRWLWTHALWAP